MFNRNAKRNELRQALSSGDPYAVGRAFRILGVAPTKSSSPPNPPSSKDPLHENGVDFGSVAKLLLDANEYAANVSIELSGKCPC